MKKEMHLCVLVIVALLISGCAPEAQPVPTVTSMPTETPNVIVFTATVKPTAKPTSTPRPTPTATPIPDWVTNYAEPILNAIADRPPTYQDDFSNPRSGWYVGTTSGKPDVLIYGEKGYFEGEYRIVANGATSENPTVCSGGEDENVGRYADFVAEFDVRFVSGVAGDWQIQFHRNDSGLYSLSMEINFDTIHFGKCSSQTGPGCGGMATYSGNQVNGGDGWNHMLLITRGARMAAYANGVPILYTEDKTYTDEFGMGYFSLNSCNTGDKLMETRWDNLKIWDISNLP